MASTISARRCEIRSRSPSEIPLIWKHDLSLSISEAEFLEPRRQARPENGPTAHHVMVKPRWVDGRHPPVRVLRGVRADAVDVKLGISKATAGMSK